MKKMLLVSLLIVTFALPVTLSAQTYSPAGRIVQGKTGQLFAITATPKKDGKTVGYEVGSAIWSTSNQLAAKVEGYKTLNAEGVPVDGSELQALVTLQGAGSFVIMLVIHDGAGNDVVAMFADRTVTGLVTTIQLVPTSAVDPQ